MDEDEMHALLAERLRRKLDRDFDGADEIQLRLAEGGVYVHDGRKEWRADGASFGDVPRRRQQQEYDATSYGDGGGDDDAMSPTRGRFFDVKPGIERGSRSDLERGSRSDRDRRRTDWSNLDPGRGHDYALSVDAGPNSSQMDEEDIHALLARRLQLKRKRRFDQADEIQMQLNDAGVYVHDRRREWRADGSPFADLGTDNAASASAARGSRRPSGGNYGGGGDEEYDDEEPAGPVRKFRRGGRVEVEVAAPEEEGRAEESKSKSKSNEEERNASPPPTPSEDEEEKEKEDNLGSLTVVKLKERLRSAGLPVSGRKAELVERLRSSGGL
uniref:SAP domain-containing protein n=1 Tax=Odontella aurita TaxID=265563 RepID=A0A7S4N1J8_9STRA|mmetsp:Transcript_43687/g.132918  ORF Transcript_43687/g.132918 Transcript_43687/m.132918 type:complete len:329 (+) Transcript_43687:502-1488(+)